LDESVLHRQIGDRQTMANQLRYLVQCSAKPMVAARVLRLRGDTPASTYGTFEIFELPAPFPEVA
jgi:hypothetical protein